MRIIIANHDFTIQWDGIYYLALSDYPNISEWELQKIVHFHEHERNHGRTTTIECENADILHKVNHALANRKLFFQTNIEKPALVTECTECRHNGCLTDFLCHTSSVENGKLILKSGKLLSAVNARGIPGEILAKEKRNGANDPPDYFDHIMFTWGNCVSGDKLVAERELGRFPNEQDLSAGFSPGVRFYFKYDDIANHPNFVNDGYHHGGKIKDELVLADYLHCCIVPAQHKSEFARIVPPNIADKVVYIENDCADIWHWAEKVYEFVRTLKI